MKLSGKFIIRLFPSLSGNITEVPERIEYNIGTIPYSNNKIDKLKPCQYILAQQMQPKNQASVFLQFFSMKLQHGKYQLSIKMLKK